MDRANQVAGGLRLLHDAPNSGPQALEDVLIIGVHRQQERPGRRRDPGDLASCVHPVQDRHREVEHGRVGTPLPGQLHGGHPIGGFPDDLEVLALQQDFHALPDDQMVVGQHDARRHLTSSR